MSCIQESNVESTFYHSRPSNSLRLSPDYNLARGWIDGGVVDNNKSFNNNLFGKSPGMTNIIHRLSSNKLAPLQF